MTQGSIIFAGANGVLSQNNANFYWDDTTKRHGIGVNSNLLGTLDVRTTSGTLAVATVSGQTSFAALVVDNSGRGDLFSASSSGLNRFVITQNGNVGIGTTTPGALLDVNGNILLQAGGIIDARSSGNLSIATGANTNTLILGRSGQTINLPGYASANNSVLYADNTANGVLTKVTATSTANQCLLSGATAPVWGSCDLGTTSWVQANGTVYPGNLTQDLLIAGSATSSATFHVYGAALTQGTNPVASISAKTSFASLAVNNNGTGDLFTASNSSIPVFTIKQNGNLVFGNTTQGTLSPIGLTAARTWTLPDATGTLCLSTNNCGFASGTNYWTTFTNSSNTIIAPSPLTQGLSIGNAGTGNYLPFSSLYVEPAFNSKGNALVGINQTGSGPIFTASQAGTTKFVIDNAGNVGIGTTTPLSNLQIGNQTAASTATPITLSLGATYSNFNDTIPKFV